MKGLLGAFFLLAASFANAENYQVQVGAGGLIFNPNTVTADIGDTVEFIVTGVSLFLAQTNTVR